MERMSKKEPVALGEILADLSAITSHRSDPVRAADNERNRLSAEVAELTSQRIGQIEAQQAGDGDRSDLAITNQALLAAEADVIDASRALDDAVHRHPSNP